MAFADVVVWSLRPNRMQQASALAAPPRRHVRSHRVSCVKPATSYQVSITGIGNPQGISEVQCSSIAFFKGRPAQQCEDGYKGFNGSCRPLVPLQFPCIPAKSRSSGKDFIDFIHMDEVEANHRLQDALTYQLLGCSEGISRKDSTQALGGAPAFNVRKLKAFRDHVTRNLAPTVARGFAQASSLLARATGGRASSNYQQPHSAVMASDYLSGVAGMGLSSHWFGLTCSLFTAAVASHETSDLDSPAPWLDPMKSPVSTTINAPATFAEKLLEAGLCSDDTITHRAAAETALSGDGKSISTHVKWIPTDHSPLGTQMAASASLQQLEPYMAVLAPIQQAHGSQRQTQAQLRQVRPELKTLDEGKAGGLAAVAQRPLRRRRGSRGGGLLEGAGRLMLLIPSPGPRDQQAPAH